jgi:uncharacterized protein (TIGR02246 family)
MSSSSPTQPIEALIRALEAGDIDSALACYEDGAAMVVRPGQVARGREPLREALAGFVALRPTMTTETFEVVSGDGLALYLSKWRLAGTAPDGSAVALQGSSTDVVRRQSDGRWLIALDNPWGSAILA